MTLKKAFILSLCLFSTVSSASEYELSLKILSPQVQSNSTLLQEETLLSSNNPLTISLQSSHKKTHKKNLISQHKEEYLNYQKELETTEKIIINPKDLTHEQFIAFMRLMSESKINFESPKSVINTYDPIQHLFKRLTNDVSVLCLQGGGTRGIMEAVFCDYIEKTTGKRIHELFKAIVATSTGSIIGAAFCYDRPQNEGTDELDQSESFLTGPYTAAEVVTMYKKMSGEIFSQYNYSSFGGVNGTQYDDKPAIKAFQQFYGNVLLSEAKTIFITTTQNLSDSEPYTFSSEKAKKDLENEETNLKVWQAIRAAIGAPTYFEPTTLGKKTFGDGGITNNKPDLIALAEVCSQFNINPHELLLLSLGTGVIPSNPNKSFKQLKAIGWLQEISTNVFNGKNQDFITKEWLNISEDNDILGRKGAYLQLQPILPEELYQLANYDEKFLDKLIKIAEDLIEEHKGVFDEFINKLMRQFDNK